MKKEEQGKVVLQVRVHLLMSCFIFYRSKYGFIACCGHQGPQVWFQLNVVICTKCSIFVHAWSPSSSYSSYPFPHMPLLHAPVHTTPLFNIMSLSRHMPPPPRFLSLPSTTHPTTHNPRLHSPYLYHHMPTTLTTLAVTYPHPSSPPHPSYPFLSLSYPHLHTHSCIPITHMLTEPLKPAPSQHHFTFHAQPSSPNTHAYHHPHTHANPPCLYTLPNMHSHHPQYPCISLPSHTHHYLSLSTPRHAPRVFSPQHGHA